MKLEDVTPETFVPSVGESFALDAGEAGRLDFELVDVTPSSGPGGDPARRHPFSIVFLGPVDPILPQRIYRLEHPSVGVLEIFIVPVGRDEAGTRYEAVFA